MHKIFVLNLSITFEKKRSSALFVFFVKQKFNGSNCCYVTLIHQISVLASCSFNVETSFLEGLPNKMGWQKVSQ